MEPVGRVALMWLLFGGSHVLLAVSPIRERLVALLGKRGFGWAFVVVAAASFTALVVTYTAVQGAGPEGLDAGPLPWLRSPLVVAMVVGIVFMVGAFAPSGYLESPSAIFGEGVRPPWGLERITRHPFFTGTVLVMGAHALLATRLTGTVFFAGFVVLSIV